MIKIKESRVTDMLMPDCRQDDYYNYDFLSEEDKTTIDGFDLCTDVLQNLDPDDIDITIDVRQPDEASIIKAVISAIEDRIESERDEMIVSMIDDMPDDEYQKQRNLAFCVNGTDGYFDTRKFACTGKRFFDGKEVPAPDPED